MQLKRLLLLSFTLLITAACSGDIEYVPPVNSNPGNGGGNTNDGTTPGLTVPNGDFSQKVSFDGKEGGWKRESAWYSERAKMTYHTSGGRKNSACIEISCIDGSKTTDAPLVQKVSGFEPGKVYKISAYIKTEGIDKGRGGSVGVFDRRGFIASAPLTGTNDWTLRTVLYVAEHETADVCCRLGFWGGDSQGRAMFDDVRVTIPTDIYTQESEHNILHLTKSLVTVSDAAIQGWLARLDAIYESYCELFDFFKPFGGKKSVILSNLPVSTAWAIAGYPIQWHPDYIKSTLEDMAKYDDAVFGIMHEMGHNFAPSNYNTGTYNEGNNSWNWNEELFANFRMYYALCHNDFNVYMHDRIFVGSEISQMYRKFYLETLAAGKPTDGDGLMYVMTRMADAEGWEPFKRAFKELYNMDPSISCGSTKWKKIEYFFDVVSKYAGKDLMSAYFSNEEIALLKTLE
jgi:hypothetical protein